MNVYVFRGVEQLTGNYHSGGGLLVVARDRAHAESLIEAENAWEADSAWKSINIRLTEDEWQQVVVIQAHKAALPQVIVFPDAGCC